MLTMLECEAVVFDLDGVLVDSNAIVARHFVAWARRHELGLGAFSADHHGLTTIETIRIVAPHLDAAAEALLLETAEGDDTEGLVAFAGARRLLAEASAGRWGIATSGTRRTASNRIRHVGFPEPAVLVTADDVARGKPAPDPYLLAASRLGVDPRRCVVIEDAPAGVRAARAAGARVVAVTTTNAAPPLTDAGAEVVVPTLDHLRLEVTGSGLRVSWPGPP